MSKFFQVVHIDKEVYVREYLIPAKCFPFQEPIHLHTECCKTTGQDIASGYYKLSLYLSVGQCPVRNHLMSAFFGTLSMIKPAIDHTIDFFVNTQIADEAFPQLIADYLNKESMWAALKNQLTPNQTPGHASTDNTEN